MGILQPRAHTKFQILLAFDPKHQIFEIRPNDSSKQFRYQAEALVFRSVPLEALHGLCFIEESIKLDLDLKQKGLKNQLEIVVKLD